MKTEESRDDAVKSRAVVSVGNGRRGGVAAAVAAAALIATPVQGHHSFAMYNVQVTRVFTGVVTRINPAPNHLQIFFAPMNEERNGSKFLGRDHHPRAFSLWMAGGGIKPGVTVGETDELGYNTVEDAADVHDVHATVLRLLGIEHTKLTYRFQGRDFRLTDVSGNVIDALLA